MPEPYSVAVLVVSDTAAATPSTDLSGPALRELLHSHPDFNVVQQAVVPDDKSRIHDQVKRWCDTEGIELVLTSGGTGFGIRDLTPEALTPLIDKHAPGLVIQMINASLSITPFASIARPVAGIHLNARIQDGTGTMIITLPGSPKGAKENLQSLLRVLPHALELSTRGGSGKAVHKELGNIDRTKSVVPSSSTEPLVSEERKHRGCGHDHGHHAPKPRTGNQPLSQDPSRSDSDSHHPPVAKRQRASPYPMVEYREALSLIFDHTPVTSIETMPTDERLIGHVLAQDVVSDVNIPMRPSTNVDGYAVRSTDKPGVYRVVIEYPSSPLPEGTIYRINTGAPLPPGMDSVIMVEDTQVTSTENDEEREVELLAQVEPGENVRNLGGDVKVGEKVLEQGNYISGVGGELGTLAFIIKRSAKVHRKPIVAVLSTGNELVNIQDTSKPKHSTSSFSAIIDSNRPSLIQILRNLHFQVLDLGIIGDTMAETVAALKKGKEEADIIVTTGGTSMGVGDLLKPCIERELGGTVHFGRVAIKPGKPTTFATLPAHPMAPNQDHKLVFALPGNPASALVTFFIFVLPALRKMQGRRKSEWELPRVPVVLNSTVPLDPRPEYHRVWVRPTTQGLKAFSTGGQRSSRTVSLAGVNGLLELPSETKEEKEKKQGETVMCVLVGEIGSSLA
ncbi:BZ3500_MvSof-1268-A1-R1_Chr2-2g05086 [Microbotryum saponariae]|uniref:BZ3500_MvSof-1268-A1-R1_Chr2-2g05086 protein n=1 Tax=Microbotryum saponariae TaxID=289078 RepID=A0A2X0L8A4_9BASI|nr:BZ3500_MvSof-1268-A1-R1_Chr2-2g05086 [Microbotryum saponariae]SDA00878.1 BZ3501_MvSof-1269-A2-R1_Chr2-2g04760 [Microbotryum saponariae]